MVLLFWAFSASAFACSAGNVKLAAPQDHAHFYWQGFQGASVGGALGSSQYAGTSAHEQAKSRVSQGVASSDTTRGAYVHLAEALFAPLEVVPRFDQTLPWKRALKQLESGDLDVVIGLSRQHASDTVYYLQPAIGGATPRIFLRSDSEFTFSGWTSLKPMVGGALKTARFGPAFDAFAARNLELERVATRAQNLEKLLQGRVDYIIDHDIAMQQWLSREPYASQVKAQPSALFSLPLYVVISKASACYAHRERLTEQLRSLVASGQWRQFQAKAHREWSGSAEQM